MHITHRTKLCYVNCSVYTHFLTLGPFTISNSTKMEHGSQDLMFYCLLCQTSFIVKAQSAKIQQIIFVNTILSTLAMAIQAKF